tara:strand:+ start:851 stop:1144 length:294 start_codon:yes stop_codon:yes gene_type:complete
MYPVYVTKESPRRAWYDMFNGTEIAGLGAILPKDFGKLVSTNIDYYQRKMGTEEIEYKVKDHTLVTIKIRPDGTQEEDRLEIRALQPLEIEEFQQGL